MSTALRAFGLLVRRLRRDNKAQSEQRERAHTSKGVSPRPYLLNSRVWRTGKLRVRRSSPVPASWSRVREPSRSRALPDRIHPRPPNPNDTNSFGFFLSGNFTRNQGKSIRQRRRHCRQNVLGCIFQYQ